MKTGTYRHRFFHLKPAAAPATDTDIGPLLSAPRSHTGSWPCHKCEHLTDTRGNTSRERKGLHCSHSHFLSSLHPHLHSSQRLRATRLPSLILAELTLRCRRRSGTHSVIIRFLCRVVAQCLHLSPRDPPSPTLTSYSTATDS